MVVGFIDRGDEPLFAASSDRGRSDLIGQAVCWPAVAVVRSLVEVGVIVDGAARRA